MRTTHDFLVPDYYLHFHCKIGGCRHACCVGWPVSISMQDYFHLLGVECSPELRRRLDDSLRIVQHPSREYYAQICPGYEGNCGLQLRDGRCALHAELGEEALSELCRLYPRGIRTGRVWECSCANSCEGVLEMFLHREEPLAFGYQSLTLEAPPQPAREFPIETGGHEEDIRQYLIRILQDRRQSLPGRLMAMKTVLDELQCAIAKQEMSRIEKVLESPLPLSCLSPQPVTQEHLVCSLEIAERLVEEVEEHSRSVHEYGVSALAWFRQDGDPCERYTQALRNFQTLVPRWECFFEHVFVNHAFFEQFPFQDRPLDLPDEHIGLCAGYALLRFLCLGWLAEHPAEEDFVDVCAATFRLLDHTAFDAYSAQLLKGLGVSTTEELWDFIRL